MAWDAREELFITVGPAVQPTEQTGYDCPYAAPVPRPLESPDPRRDGLALPGSCCPQHERANPDRRPSRGLHPWSARGLRNHPGLAARYFFQPLPPTRGKPKEGP